MLSGSVPVLPSIITLDKRDDALFFQAPSSRERHRCRIYTCIAFISDEELDNSTVIVYYA